MFEYFNTLISTPISTLTTKELFHLTLLYKISSLVYGLVVLGIITCILLVALYVQKTVQEERERQDRYGKDTINFVNTILNGADTSVIFMDRRYCSINSMYDYCKKHGKDEFQNLISENYSKVLIGNKLVWERKSNQTNGDKKNG